MSENFSGELIIYQTEDGTAKIECRLVDNTIWLSKGLIAELFDWSRKTISEHLNNIFEENELLKDSVVRYFEGITICC